MAHRKTIVRQVNSRRKTFPQGQDAVLPVNVQPAIQQAGHRYGQDSFLRYALGQVTFPGGGVGSGAGAVADLKPVGVLAVNHDKPVPADAGHQGFNHVEGRGGSQGGVGKVAAPLQYGNAGLGGQGMPRTDHSVASHKDGTIRLVTYTVG